MARLDTIQGAVLEKRISKLEQDLIKFKASQRYGMGDIQTSTSQKLTYSSHTFQAKTPDEQYSFTASATDIYVFRFTGDKPSKTVVGTLCFEIKTKTLGTTAPWVTYLKSYRRDTNSLEWVVATNGGNDFSGAQYSTFDVDFYALTNEHGIFTVANTYNISSYYHWVFG